MKSSNQFIYEISLHFPSACEEYEDILTTVLINEGVKTEDIVFCEENKKRLLSIFTKQRDLAFALKRIFKKFNLKNVDIVSKRLQKVDWQTLWKKDFKPLELTNRLNVIPTWHKNKKRYQKPNSIFIDTSVAFGTGMHVTTRFTSQLIERCTGKFKTFFDIGTGTGILSIVASKCGAEEISAIDLSKDAIKIARENFQENRCSPQYLKAMSIDNYKRKDKFDFIAANLISQDLMHFGKKITSLMAKNGYLAVSGISSHSYAMVRKNFKCYPLKCLKILKGEGWAAILYKKI